MADWLKSLVDEYYRWLRENTDIVPADGGWAVIATPFLGAFNDSIEIYARRDKGRILLSDDGETVRNLELQGCDILGSKKRVEIAEGILRGYGVRLDKGKGELLTESGHADFPRRKHDLLMAISEVNDMVVLARPAVRNIFKEDVRAFLDEREVIYTPQFMCRGDTGMPFTFDFHIAGKDREIVVKAIDNINKHKVVDFLFGWSDIRGPRRKESRKDLGGVVVINDERLDDDAGINAGSIPVGSDFLRALEQKGADHILWSEREAGLIKLAA